MSTPFYNDNFMANRKEKVIKIVLLESLTRNHLRMH